MKRIWIVVALTSLSDGWGGSTYAGDSATTEMIPHIRAHSGYVNLIGDISPARFETVTAHEYLVGSREFDDSHHRSIEREDRTAERAQPILRSFCARVMCPPEGGFTEAERMAAR